MEWGIYACGARRQQHQSRSAPAFSKHGGIPDNRGPPVTQQQGMGTF